MVGAVFSPDATLPMPALWCEDRMRIGWAQFLSCETCINGAETQIFRLMDCQ